MVEVRNKTNMINHDVTAQNRVSFWIIYNRKKRDPSFKFMFGTISFVRYSVTDAL